MKRQIAATLCALLLAANGTALAAEQPEQTTTTPIQEIFAELPQAPTLYPSEIQNGEVNGHPRIEKVYILTAKDDPDSLPTDSFKQEGYRYTLVDILRNDYSESSEREHMEVFSMESSTKDMAEILQTLEPTLEYSSEDGYLGTLTLDHTTISVEAAGYSNRSYTVSATRTYPNLSDADLSLLPKTVEENGRTLTLADVDWQTAAGTQADGYELAVRYNAVASYTGTATSKSATGYIVTATYGGVITKTATDKVVYTVVFSGTPTEDSTQSNQPSSENTDDGVNMPIIGLAVCAAVSVGLIAMGVYHKKRKGGNS